MSTETQILLPEAGVDIFLKDKETSEAVRQLADDWRFARVNVSLEEGDVETAIQSYKETNSPTLVIVETDTTDESFVARLEELAGQCSEGTHAIVIGPVNDVNLYRHLTSIGVSDYLVNPVPVETLSEVIAKSLIEHLGASGSRLIATIGAKGGVGTSSITQALALGLSEQAAQKTFLMDASGGWSSLSVSMGFDPSTTLHEAVRAAAIKDWDVLGRMIHKANDKLSVLASGADPMLEPSVHAQQYEELLDMVMGSYPVVITDLSDSIPSLKKAVLDRAHQILIFTTPTLSSLRASRILIQEIKQLQGGEVGKLDLIVNMSGAISSKEVPTKDIEEALGFKPSLTIPFDPKLFFSAENEGKKMSSDKDGKTLINKLLPLTQSVLSSAATPDQNDEGALGTINQFLNKITKK
ncbi:MAG: AAA family ATPase [Pseudomonadota bacterium]